MITVCVFAPELNHEFETIAFYFKSNGANVIVVSQLSGSERSEHPWSLQRVQQTQRLQLISDDPIPSDILISDAFMNPQHMAQRSRWAAKARSLAFHFPHRGMTLKRRLGHIVRSWPHSIMARSAIFFGDRRLSTDTLPPTFQARAFYAPYLHPQLFTPAMLQRVFAKVDVERTRTHSIGFIGNKHPQERSAALAESRVAIDQVCTKSFWIEYGDDEHHLALTPEQFLSVMEDMDFCLCPVGWVAWTHRVIEALCRGAVPIVPYPHLYGLGLRDSVNCISVKDDDWSGSVTRAISLPAYKVKEMRRNVLKLRDNMLTPSVASRRFSEQFHGTP
jgi:hypothetical protein